ncbi:MAG: 4'-phosphopantetheinyl transferase superfamily protein [Atopobiaceae bacterium]|nr:4'-phosphopantetheinyl transferase superfamily protein [Atopobiaceae bacterium]MBR1829104.1 4'-phosphopantetheinyl transferase superfamily protein [Atopobiaceae bacterium]
MPDLHVVKKEVTRALAHEALAGLGCTDFGIVVLQGATSWDDAREGLAFNVTHDERDAPFAVDDDGNELTNVKVSFSDENDYLAFAWAVTAPNSPLLGLGIDLASADDFGQSHPAAERFIKLIFSDDEHRIAEELPTGDRALSYATLFGAKEASFKSTSQPLRTWYQTHDQELSFEVRHFSMTMDGTERGEQRDGAAQRAMDHMGIGHIDVHYTRVENMALVIATALAPQHDAEVTHGIS